LPKRGFTNKLHAEPMVPINIGTIQEYIDMGRISATKVLNLKDLVDAGMCKPSAIKHGIKLLAKGEITSPIQLQVSRASGAAIEAIEQAGGEVTTVHYNRLALRALLKPEKFEVIPKQARPPPKLQAYYTNWDDNRGYMSVQAQMRELLKEHPELEEAFAKALEGKKGDQ
jgi:large subunit ribosomal protein L15